MIMQCLSSSFFELLLNGSIVGSFKAKRGMRQGDPLSPFLFIIFLELLSCILNSTANDGLIHGIKMAKNAHSVNHLLFANDLVLFCHALV